jgi:hypothetical protein
VVFRQLTMIEMENECNQRVLQMTSSGVEVDQSRTTCGCHPSKQSGFGPVSLDGTVQPNQRRHACREIDQKMDAKVRLHVDASVDAIGDAVLGSDTTHRRRKKKEKEKKKATPSVCGRINVAPIVVKPSNSFAALKIFV